MHATKVIHETTSNHTSTLPLPINNRSSSKSRMLIMPLVVKRTLPQPNPLPQTPHNSLQHPLNPSLMPSIPIPNLHKHTPVPHPQTHPTNVVLETGNTLFFDRRLQGFPDRQHADDFPELGRDGFGDAERPGPAAQVARVFPDGFDAAFEEVDAVAEREEGEVEVVEEGPEGADVGDLGEEDQAFLVLVW